MRVLVTGGAGFVGAVLVPILIDRGHFVRVVDCGSFGLEGLDPRAEFVEGDILDFKMEWLDGIDSVIHLAGISNDPMAAFSPSLNYTLNASGTAIVAHYAKERGVQRFVFASSCSVYGFNDAVEVNEDVELLPSFPYAIAKVMGERAIACLGDNTFRPIALRKGTVVGWSPRMRFDLVTNAMIKNGLTQGTIVVHNPKLWRPLLNVQDAARAYVAALEADLSITGTYNIATENFSIGQLGEIVAQGMREFGVKVQLQIENRPDFRSYRVSTERARKVLGFRPTITMGETVHEIMTHLMAKEITDFSNPRYYNVEQMKINMARGGLVLV